MEARSKDFIRIEILANGAYRGEVRYPHCPLFKLDVDDMVKFIYEKRPTLKYEDKVDLWLDGKEHAIIQNNKKRIKYGNV